MKLTEVQPSAPSISPEAFMLRFGVSHKEAYAMHLQAMSERLFVNEEYQVSLSHPHPTTVPGWPPMIHLSVVRRDGAPVRSWADMQAIKNELVGPEFEAIEIYPAESRLVDCGSNYHLWVFSDPQFRVPMGWSSRRVQKG